MGGWVSVDGGAVGEFSDEAPVHCLPPAGNVHVFKVDVITSVRLIATDDSWRKETAVTLKIPDSDVSNVDMWLGLTPSEWVCHTSWTSTIWLLLLLWSDVDVVPHWEVNLDVLIENVLDLSSSSSWISLNIYRLKWILKVNIPKSDSPDTRMCVSWRHRPNGHSYSKLNVHVLDQDVLRAAVFCDFVTLMRGLHSNRIVKVGDVYIPDGILDCFSRGHQRFRSIELYCIATNLVCRVCFSGSIL